MREIGKIQCIKDKERALSLYMRRVVERRGTDVACTGEQLLLDKKKDCAIEENEREKGDAFLPGAGH